jgi:phage terminase large subunit
MAYETLQCIVEYCQEHLSDNVLVVKSKERCKLVVPENSHLQDSKDKEGEHREGEVDNELHTTNAMIVYDATLSSNDSYYAQINNNCSEEVCLILGMLILMNWR